MKKVIIVLVGIIFMGCSSDSKTEYSSDSENLFLTITSSTKKEELSNISAEFKDQKNILIDFSKSDFDNNGVIKNLNISVDCQDGFSGSTHASSLFLKMNDYGFYRNYSENVESPFGIGKM